ncbi:MAG: polyprenyl synthetase family protein [Chloroflexi bacterium]|nr:polyprenyl synthetase family protein [Chloroflexota bacterium]
MSTLVIFDPIRDDLQLVGKTMRDIAAKEMPQLALPLEYVLKNEGKLVRPAITLLSGKVNNYNPGTMVPIAAASELIHLASLLHDDTIDRADIRRGEPTVNKIWGNTTAVLVGDYIFARAAYLIATMERSEIVKLFAETLMSLCRGVIAESHNKYNWNLQKEQYFQRIYDKTASLFTFAAGAGSILSEAGEKHMQALTAYGLNLGMAFQIIDDILDFTGEERELGKPVGGDLLQGVITIPVIIYIAKNKDSDIVKQLIRGNSEDSLLKKFVEEIRNSSVIGESYNIANEFSTKSAEAIIGLPESAAKKSMIELTRYVTGRNK